MTEVNQMSEEIVLLYVTHESEDKAKELALNLLEQKLVACANLWPMKSLYVWKESLHQDDEVVLILKTTEDLCEKARDEALRLHTYETPCVLRLDAQANAAFYQWVCGETAG